MNKSYKIVYSKARKRCVVVSEIARAFAGRVQASRTASVSALMAALGTALLAASGVAEAVNYVGTDGSITITVDGTSYRVNGVGLVMRFDGGTGGDKGKRYNLRSPNSSSTIGVGSNALGDYAEASGYRSNAFGGEATASGRYSNALGLQAIASSEGANALGMNALASGKNANAIGTGATASAENAFALGVDSVADEANTVSVGRAAKAATDTEAGVTGITRRIVNVAAGTKASDAATVGQLQTVSKKAGEQYLNLDSTTDGTTGITNNELSINASDTIASGTTGLATVKAVYDEVRPTADGSYVKTTQSTAANLAALDKQVSDNSDALGYLSINPTNAALTDAPSTSAKATGAHSTAVGENALASGANSRAFGYNASASGDESIAIGTQAVATGWGSSAIGVNASAKGHNAVAFGDDSKADGSSSIAFGSNAFASYGGIAVGFKSKSTAAGALALGSESVANVANTVSVGRAAVPASGSTAAVSEITRRIVNVAEGTNATDAATVSQIATVESASPGLLTVAEAADKNTNGSKRLQITLKTGDLTDGASEALVTNTTVKNALGDYAKADGSNVATGSAVTWAEKIGVGEVASESSLLITGKKIYTEVRPVADSGETLSYVSADKTTAANLKALDKQVAANTGDIGDLKDLSNISEAGEGKVRTLAKEAVKLENGAYTEVESSDSADGKTKTYKVNVKAEGAVADGDNGIVKGGTVYAAIQNLKSATDTTIGGLGNTYAKLDGTNLGGEGSAFNAGKWAEALSADAVIAGSGTGSNLLVTGAALYDEVRPVAGSDETLTYVGADKTTAANLKALDKQVAANTGDIGGLKDLANITETGKSNVRTLAKEAVQLENGAYTEVESSDSDDGKTKTYKVNVKADGAVAENNDGIVKGGVVYTAIQALKDATDTTISGLGNTYAKLDGTNLSGEGSTFNAGNWATALGGGVIGGATVTNSNLLVTGSTVFAEVRPEHDGNYVKNEWTAGKNFIELDSLIKGLSDKVEENDGKISAVNEKAEAAKTAAAAAQGKADLAYGKAEEAKAEALKHSSVVSSNGHLTVTQGTNADGGVQYDLAISEDIDFTAKQTTWKDGDAFSTANSSGFFSGGLSAENADAYMSKGVVSAGTDAEKKIRLDGNTGKATFGKTVTIDGTTGKISGVAAGEVSETSTDAVNGSQLYEVQQGVAQNAEGLESLGRAVNKVDRKIDRTGALAAALAGLHPQDYDEDHPVSGAVGIGHYKGKQALAVGMFVRPVENFMVSLGASGSSDDYMLNAGASFRFGGPTLKKSPQQMMARLSDQEVTIRDLSAQNQAQKTRLESQDEKLAKQASEIEKLKALVADIQKKLAK